MKIFEEMKKLELKPTAQTFICLINACAAAGRVDQVYAFYHLPKQFDPFFANSDASHSINWWNDYT